VLSEEALKAQQLKNSEVTSAMERRRRALAVDRFSRFFFPLSFGLLNCIYWIVFSDINYESMTAN
jgi:hypothetical protein